MSSVTLAIRRIESLIRIDPAQRGLLAGGAASALGLGELELAARHLAANMRHVAIVTGFAIPTGAGFHTETDGPLGAIVLGSALMRLGATVSFVTDSVNVAPLRTVARHALGTEANVLECPLDPRAAHSWRRKFLAELQQLTHLIAVERVGPSHTLDTMRAQNRNGPPPADEFQRIVPESGRGCCLNMRGESLDATTAPLHLLFEEAARLRPDLKTIGMCDGGNEIGIGRFAWELVHPLVNGGHGPKIVCRTVTDWTILAGTSNWAAYALAAAVARIQLRVDVLRDWTQQRHEELLELLVNEGPAVDGVTRLQQPTVDGLPFITYIQPWNGIREALGLDSHGEPGT
ncbi:MAG: DUF4392 domain-containing protein [Planctomycetota bacterium]|nr:MAG: DUF4392 domain-containing protein [Planctomycetota bacterium]REK22561.1 MAG: DUF4392 domain-containing protein [Planctomycetota bacterium]REK36017.1 MAG: DUF4392 domain-containing protein [Planctomycetota bacterium]